MALNIVTDTDVAAATYSAAPAIAFRLDGKNKGPFAAMLPLSTLLDPAQAQAGKDRIRDQLAAIPYASMRDSFLQADGAAYVVQAAFGAAEQATMAIFAKNLLERASKIPPEPALANLSTEYALEARIYHWKSAAEAIEACAADNQLTPEKAAIRLVEKFSALNPPVIAEIRAEREKFLASPQNRAIGEAAKLQALEPLLHPLAPQSASAIRKAATEGPNQDEQLADAFRKAMQQSSPARKDTMLQSIAATVEAEKLKPPRLSLNESITQNTRALFNGRPMQYNLEQTIAAHGFTADPAAAATALYTQMKERALATGAKPEKPVRDILPKITSALADCPAHIRASAEAASMKIVVVDDHVDMDSLFPNPGGMVIASKTMGGSTGQGIYVSRKMLGMPHILKEEIIHEVEGQALRSPDGSTARFSAEESWQKALSSDMAASENPITAHTLRKQIILDENSGTKANRAVRPGVNLTPGNASHQVAFAEAVPDLYHIKAALEAELRERKSIRIGGKMGFGGTKFTTADDMMRAAFPSAWPLLEGPRAGGQLVQQPDGRVDEIPATERLPASAAKVTSLKAYCEGAPHHAATAEIPAPMAPYREAMELRRMTTATSLLTL